MTKRLKILLFLLAVCFSLFVYLLFTSESFKQGTSDKIKNFTGESNENQEQISANYKISAAKIISDYDSIGSDLTIGEAKAAKDSLLALKVPTDLKDLHLNLIMSLTKMEDYFSSGDEKIREESQNIIKQAKISYDWLSQ